MKPAPDSRRKALTAAAARCARYVVFAQTQPGSGRKGIAAFVVEAQADGVRDDKIEDKMGMRGTVNATVEFDTWVGPMPWWLNPDAR